ncbi:MAG: helix-turn-helix domain-containing protein [Streptomycetales bacterium]
MSSQQYGVDGCGQVGIGQRVRTARLFRGMSIKTLAQLTGVSVGWLSEVENGKRTCGPAFAFRCAR